MYFALNENRRGWNGRRSEQEDGVWLHSVNWFRGEESWEQDVIGRDFLLFRIVKRWSVWWVPSAWQANQVHRQGHGASTIRICVADREVFTRHHQRPICYHALPFVLRPNRILLDFAIKGVILSILTALPAELLPIRLFSPMGAMPLSVSPQRNRSSIHGRPPLFRFGGGICIRFGAHVWMRRFLLVGITKGRGSVG